MEWSPTSGAGERQEELRQPLKGPFAKATLLHLAVIAALFGYAFVHNFFRGSEWGSNSFEKGAIQATLVNSVAVPLPQDHPPTPNVLATQTPSVAPAIPEKVTQPIPLPEAVPIPVKKPPVKKAEKPHAKTPPPTKQPPPKPQHKATFGEAAPANLPRAAASNPNANSPVQVTGGDFGSRFGWYVNIIKQRVAQNWLIPEVSPDTPVGATVYIQFSIGRDGAPSDASIATPSGSPSLDSSCLRAVQRVSTFGRLPTGYNESSLSVLYHCTYPGRQ